MNKIKKIGVFSFGRFQAVMGALVGLVCGVLYSFGGFFIDLLVSMGWMTSAETPGLSYGTVLAFGALVGMPVLFGIAGFLLGLIEAFLYNFYVKWFGGVGLKISY